jgi:hypothetical protein
MLQFSIIRDLPLPNSGALEREEDRDGETGVVVQCGRLCSSIDVLVISK